MASSESSAACGSTTSSFRTGDSLVSLYNNGNSSTSSTNTQIHYDSQSAVTSATAADVQSILSDTPAGHKKYLTQLVEVITAMGREPGFSNKTHDGNTITYKTFYDGTKFMAEVVHRVIIMLLVNFGFMSQVEARYGVLNEDWKPMEGAYFAVAGVNPPNTQFTMDGLHNKILRIFYRNSDSISIERYYDASVLFFPELNLKKTRTALSYFMQFCMNANDLTELSIDMTNEMSIVRHKNKKKALKKRKANDALRSEIEKETGIMAQLEAEIQAELKKLQQQSTEASAQMKNLSVEEIDASTKKTRNELETLEGEFQKLKHLPPKPKVACASSSKSIGTQTPITKGISHVGNVRAPILKSKIAEASIKDERCQKPGCRCRNPHH